MARMIFLRIWRSWGLMAILLFATCLVIAFMALGPLYVEAISNAEFDQRIQNASDSRFQIEIRSKNPFLPQTMQSIGATLDKFNPDSRPYASAASFMCGYEYIPNQPLTDQTPRTDRFQCYRAYAYPDIQDLFQIVEGRFPKQDSGLSIIETVISSEVARASGLQVGSRFIVGASADDAATLEVTGIVEPALSAQHPFWQGQTTLDIFKTPRANQDFRFDVTYIVPLSTLQNDLVAVAGTVEYTIKTQLDRTRIFAPDIDRFEVALEQVKLDIMQEYPNASFRDSISTLINHYRGAREESLGSMFLLSFLILFLMLYNITTIASLILQRQNEEWAIFTSRGASTLQLVWIQFLTMSLIGLIAVLFGPLLALVILMILSFIGPQSAIISMEHIGQIPMLSLQLSMIAGIATTIALTLPAWSAAKQSLSQLKQGLSRPPQLPVWSRYYLDMILFFISTGLMLRLYIITTGRGIAEMLKDPLSLLASISSSNEGVSLADPFSLLAPALLLTAVALMWVRFFPLLMQGVGRIFASEEGLTARLAFWTIERNPGHYAQLVLLLMGTLALGTASLSLSTTRDAGAWQSALHSIGAEASIVLDPRELERTLDWDSLPQTITAMPLMIVPTGSNRDGGLIGVAQEDLQGAFSDLHEPLANLFDQPEFDLGGLPVPIDAQSIIMDVRATQSDEVSMPISTRIALEMLDNLGFDYQIELETPDPTRVDNFLAYSANIENLGVPPYTITGISFLSTTEEVEAFQHNVYLDNLRILDSQENVTVLQSFEPDTRAEWRWNQSIRLSQVLETTAMTNDASYMTEGEYSLHVLYTALRSGSISRAVTMQYRAQASPPPLPVVVSTQFAKIAGERSRFQRPLRVGDTMTSPILVPSELSASASIELNYTIVNIIDRFPPYIAPESSFMIADLQPLTHRLNVTISRSNTYDAYRYYDVNHVWLDLDNSAPQQPLISAIENVPGFLSADYAWFQYVEIQRDPLSNTLTGILFVAFWLSLILTLLDFSFYMHVTIHTRSLDFATLRAIGWQEKNLLNMLTIEQAAFIAPALILGMGMGWMLAYLILPFLQLSGGLTLQMPLGSVFGLIVVIVVSFLLILRFAARALRRMRLVDVMRFGE